MVGFSHFGVPFGIRIGALGPGFHSEYMATMKNDDVWGTYAMPMPKDRRGYRLISQGTCFIVLLQFLVAPELTRILTFNCGASPWHIHQLKPEFEGFLKVTHSSDDQEVFKIWYRTFESQEELLEQYVKQQNDLKRPIMKIVLCRDRTYAEKKLLSKVDARAPPRPFTGARGGGGR
jgi:hypothetical protein